MGEPSISSLADDGLWLFTGTSSHVRLCAICRCKKIRTFDLRFALLFIIDTRLKLEKITICSAVYFKLGQHVS